MCTRIQAATLAAWAVGFEISEGFSRSVVVFALHGLVWQLKCWLFRHRGFLIPFECSGGLLAGWAHRARLCAVMAREAFGRCLIAVVSA